MIRRACLGVAAAECHPDAVERNVDPKATLRFMVSAARGSRRRARREDDLLGVWAQRLDLAQLQRLAQGQRLVIDTAAALRTVGVIR